MPVLRFSNVFICERCWRRLANKPLPATTSLHHRRPFHHSRNNRTLVVEKEVNEEPVGYYEQISNLGVEIDTNDEPRISKVKDNGEWHTLEPGQTIRRVESRSRRPNGPRKRQHDNIPEESQKRETTPYSSLLRQKTLGHSASVLVFRDAENKRQDERLPSQSEDQDVTRNKPMRVSGILQSLQDQKLDPEQSEVNAGIDAIRPPQSSFGPTTYIPEDERKKLAKDLRERFSELQLSRYLTLHRPKEPSAPESGKSKARVLKETHVYVSAWKPLEGKPDRLHTRADKTKRGRLAQQIVLSIWRIEVQQDSMRIGTIEVFVRPDTVSHTLLCESSSALEDLARVRNIKIEVSQEGSFVTITATKSAAQEAAKEVAKMLKGPHESRIDITTLQSKNKDVVRTPLDSKKLHEVAEATGCALDWTRSLQEVIVHAREQAAIDNFHRVLLMSMNLRTRFDHVYASEQEALKLPEDGWITTVPDELIGHSYRENGQGLGRYATVYSFAKDRNGLPSALPIRSKLEAPKGNNLRPPFHDAAKFLSQNTTFGTDLNEPSRRRKKIEPKSSKLSGWFLKERVNLSASFGQFLHPLPPQEKGINIFTSNVEVMPVSQPTTRPFFMPSVTGLSSLLEHTFLDEKGVKKQAIRILLIPSPYTAPETGSNTDTDIPTLEMLLQLNEKRRSFEVEELTMILGTREFGLLHPRLALDTKLVRQSTIQFSNANREPRIAAFTKTINEGRDEDDRPGLIPFLLTVSIPTCTTIPESVDKIDPRNPLVVDPTKCLVDVEYLTASYQLETNWTFPAKNGSEIIYRNVSEDEQGLARESVHLVNIQQHPEKDAPTPSRKKTQELLNKRIQGFVIDAANTHRRMNIGLGKLSAMGTEKRRIEADRRRAEKRANDEGKVEEVKFNGTLEVDGKAKEGQNERYMVDERVGW